MLGSHVPLESMDSLEGGPYQVFINEPRFGQFRKNLSEDMFKDKWVFVHMPYTWNICSPNVLTKIIECAIKSSFTGAFGAVLHVGKSVKNSVKDSLNLQQSHINAIIKHFALIQKPGEKMPKILFETPAGQGTELLSKMEDFINFAVPLIGPHFGICVDTCHVWASGYDPILYIKSIYEKGGKVDLIHFNGSLKEKGSRVDRHAPYNSHLSTIPFQTMSDVFTFATEKYIPCVTEEH